LKDIWTVSEEFAKVLKEGNREIRYWTMEKCRIRRKAGEKVVKKGQIVPQALIRKTIE
jgi:hypothetical protein